MRVLGLSGSLRRDSHNRALLRAAAAELRPDAELVEWDRIAELPAYDEDLDEALAPEPVRALREAIAEADAILIATPEYNASLPGALKNALDWASRPHATNPLRGKPAAVVGASTGLFGAVWAQAEARKVLAAIGANVLERDLPVGQAHDAWAPDGALLDPDLRAALGDIVRELVAQAGEKREFRSPITASGDLLATSHRASGNLRATSQHAEAA
ncbi:MAG: NADPH-dependent FMN reductase [Conexibacter sp.]